MKRLACVLMVLVLIGCHHRRNDDCKTIVAKSKTCGVQCHDVNRLRDALDRCANLYAIRHGDLDVAREAVANIRITWHAGNEFYDSIYSHAWVTGVCYKQNAIGVACNTSIGNSALFEELVHAILWRKYGESVMEGDPRWTPEVRETIRMLQREFR